MLALNCGSALVVLIQVLPVAVLEALHSHLQTVSGGHRQSVVA